MALESIIDQLVVIVSGVSGIELDNVHKYIKYVYKPIDFMKLFKNSNTNMINAWQITRKSTLEEEQSWNSPNGQNLRNHTFIIIGSYSVRDSIDSGSDFQNLIESVCAALRAKKTINGTAFYSDPPQVIDVTFDSVGKVLSHRCVILIKITEYLNFTIS